MPPALEPVRWRIVKAAKDTIAGMSATNFFYPPDEVAVIEPPLIQYLDRMALKKRVVYGIFAEDESPTAQATSLGKESLDLMLWIQVAKRYPEPTEVSSQDPFQYEVKGLTSEEQVRSRLIHDARRIVLSEWRTLGGDNLGGLIDHWHILAVYPMFARLAEASGWIGFEMATTIMYEYKKNDPTST